MLTARSAFRAQISSALNAFTGNNNCVKDKNVLLYNMLSNKPLAKTDTNNSNSGKLFYYKLTDLIKGYSQNIIKVIKTVLITFKVKVSKPPVFTSKSLKLLL